MTKQEILQNLEKSKERMESSNKFDLADAMAITDALIYMVRGDEITVNISLPSAEHIGIQNAEKIAREVKQAIDKRGLQNGI